jgi:hypothetical protein
MFNTPDINFVPDRIVLFLSDYCEFNFRKRIRHSGHPPGKKPSERSKLLNIIPGRGRSPRGLFSNASRGSLRG